MLEPIPLNGRRDGRGTSGRGGIQSNKGNMLSILAIGEEEDKRARGEAGAAEDGDQIGRRRGGQRRLREEGGAPDKRAEVAVQAAGGGARRQDAVGEGEQRGARRESGEVEWPAGGGGGGQRGSGWRREDGRDREEEAPVLREVHGGRGRGSMGGHSGNPKNSGRVFRVLRISGFEICNPKFVRNNENPTFRVPENSGSGSGKARTTRFQNCQQI